MRRCWTAPGMALFAGAVGCALRWRELRVSFDPDTGLSNINEPVTVGLICLTVIVLVCSLALGISIRRRSVPDGFSRAFYTNNYSSFALSALLGILCAAMAVLDAVSGMSGDSGLIFWIFHAAMAFTGFAMVALAVNAYTQKRSQLLCFWSVIPALFFCFWMVMFYRDHAGNPTLLEYSYRCYAMGASAVCFYYLAGFCFGREKPGATAAFSILATYLSVVTLADSQSITFRIFQAASAIYIAQFTARLLASLGPRAGADDLEEEGKRGNEKDGR